MEEQKSVFKRGAEMGVPMGLYMTTISVCSIFADRFATLSWVVIVLLVAGPWMVWRLQRRYYMEEGMTCEYATLWMLGILMIIYGALITGLVTWAVLQWVRPGYIYEVTQQFVDIYSTMPEMKGNELLTAMQRAIDTGSLPSPIETVTSTFWLVTFSGCVMSAITAAFAKLRG
ncbi:MAG: DUF4199 domain-containing protein [Muribaculaceae bacterium]|nr:DUF4199 domain-containing protein [Muribaculaceae bacterium]MBR1725982.1 DUF4199 domain-containing protein [Muribaculaceae bacterium]